MRPKDRFLAAMKHQPGDSAEWAQRRHEACPHVCTFPVRHHPGARGATPPHPRRGAFTYSPPESEGVARYRRGGYVYATPGLVGMEKI